VTQRNTSGISHANPAAFAGRQTRNQKKTAGIPAVFPVCSHTLGLRFVCYYFFGQYLNFTTIGSGNYGSGMKLISGRIPVVFDGGIIPEAPAHSTQTFGPDFLFGRFTAGMVSLVDVDFMISKHNSSIIAHTWFHIRVYNNYLLSHDSDGSLPGGNFLRSLNAVGRCDVFLTAGRQNKTG
jgi:hypothetical protein